MQPRGIVARVRNGRLIVDEPTELPEGTELTLVADDGGDELAPEDRARLNAALAEADEDVRQGRVIAAADVLRALRDRAR